MFTPTEEQQAIITAGRETSSSIMVQAYAGCSKTTTLVLMAAALPAVPSLALAFNKKIANELAEKFPKHFEVKTLNGLGHSAWGRAIGKRLTLDDRKLGRIITQVFKDNQTDGKKASTEDWLYVQALVPSAMNAGLVPQGFAAKGLLEDTPQAWEDLAIAKHGYFDRTLCSYAHEALTRSIKEGLSGIINFDDQIYLSALFGGVFPKFAIVMVDEAQDLSPINHIQLSKVTPASGRLIVVGDKHQAIYGFRGADTNSMGKIRGLKPSWLDLTLTQTFRCPKVVVARQHEHVPAFRAFHTNSEGTFHAIRRPEDHPIDEPFWSWSDIQELRSTHGANTVAVLCRNNAPLFSTAFRLIRQGVGCQMLGRDIGKSLGGLLKKIAPEPATPVAQCVTLIQQWIDKECSLARANGRDEKADAAHDRGYCLIAVCDSAPGVHTREDVLLALDRLFSRTNELVTLATGHRAKGLEWDLVLHLDPWRVPSPRAEGRELEQELNLRYVIETRAKLVLVHANSKDLKK